MAIYKRLRLLECAGGAQAHKLGTCTLQLPHPKDQYKIEPIGASCLGISRRASRLTCRCPTGAPANSSRATTTSTICLSPRSRWTRIRDHTRSWARIEDDFVSADEGYQGRPFPQMRRPNPGPDTDSESGPDEAFRRDGFKAFRPPRAAPSSSVSGRLGEAALRRGGNHSGRRHGRRAGRRTFWVPQCRADSASRAARAASNHWQATLMPSSSSSEQGSARRQQQPT